MTIKNQVTKFAPCKPTVREENASSLKWLAITSVQGFFFCNAQLRQGDYNHAIMMARNFAANDRRWLWYSVYAGLKFCCAFRRVSNTGVTEYSCYPRAHYPYHLYQAYQIMSRRLGLRMAGLVGSDDWQLRRLGNIADSVPTAVATTDKPDRRLTIPNCSSKE